MSLSAAAKARAAVNVKLALVLSNAPGFELANASAIVQAWRNVGAQGASLSCLAACIHDESNGENIYGDDGGAAWMSDTPFGPLQEHEVTEQNFAWFWARVRDGATSNGVGPAQLTSPDLIAAAIKRGGAHVPLHNIAEGSLFLGGLIRAHGSIEAGFAAYNGSGPVAAEYGARLLGYAQRYLDLFVDAKLATAQTLR